MKGLGFRAWGLGFRVQSLEFSVSGRLVFREDVRERPEITGRHHERFQNFFSSEHVRHFVPVSAVKPRAKLSNLPRTLLLFAADWRFRIAWWKSIPQLLRGAGRQVRSKFGLSDCVTQSSMLGTASS